MLIAQNLASESSAKKEPRAVHSFLAAQRLKKFETDGDWETIHPLAAVKKFLGGSYVGEMKLA
jgi:hypothetical protein